MRGRTTRRPRLARRWRVRSAALVALALALSSAACGIGDRQRNADVLHASLAKLSAAAPATGTLTLTLEPDRRPIAALGGAAPSAQTVPPGLGGAATPAAKPQEETLQATIQLAISGRRARVAMGTPEAEQAAVFEDTRVFVRRQNARPTERRTWATLDLRRIVDNERPLDTSELSPAASLTSVASSVNPVYLVELVRGALAGSVRPAGSEAIGGVETIRYDANVSFDKAMTDLDFDDDERAVRSRLFRLIGATKDVVPARMWIDGDGRLRRLRLELQQQVSRQRSDALTATVDLLELGAAATLGPPPEDATVTYERFGRLVRSALPEEV
jgi:hypothetical protein